MKPVGALELLRAAHPSEPALDIALSHGLLADVAAGRRAPCLRLFRPGATVAFGRLDALRAGFAGACRVARELGYTPVLRSVGGHAAVFDERCVVVEYVVHARDATAGLTARFDDQARRVRDALAALGADARIGRLSREYCPGDHSVNVGGRVKVVGVAQRIVRHGALTSAVVACSGGPELRAAIGALYAELGLDFDPATAGALDELLPGATVEAVAASVRDAYAADHRIEAREPGAALLAAARALAPRHRVP